MSDVKPVMRAATFAVFRIAVALLRQLKHANIVTLHDVIHTPNSLTLVFEYVERDLRQYLDQCAGLAHPNNVRVRNNYSTSYTLLDLQLQHLYSFVNYENEFYFLCTHSVREILRNVSESNFLDNVKSACNIVIYKNINFFEKHFLQLETLNYD